ncbi:MAG: methylated-DNA--[protein]-cysteine S-methyltransferase [Pirellulales bacterium]
MTAFAPFRPNNRRVATPRIVSASRPTTTVDVFDSDLGWIAVAAGGHRLVGVTFGHACQADAVAALESQGYIDAAAARSSAPSVDSEDGWLADLRERFKSFAAGEFEDFRDVTIDVSHLTPFERSVVQACRAIPYGETKSYGELATKVGRDGAARAVGRVMATNRFPLVVPCHRVLAAGGGLGGYSAPQGLSMKRKLLAMEAGVSGRPRRAK